MVMSEDPPSGDDPAWWRQSIGPVAFADEAVLASHPDGIPGAGLVADGPFVSANPGPGRSLERAQPDDRRPLRLPDRLPGRLPWAAGTAHSVRETGASAPEGVGFEVDPAGRGAAISEATTVYPLFPGRLRYAGCAAGANAPLGRIVVVEHVLGDHSYQAVFSHLSSVDAALGEPAAEILPNQPLGTFGSSFTAPDGSCDGTDGRGTRLHVKLLRDAVVTLAGEVTGGRTVRPWPLLGQGSFEPLRWWNGPMLAADVEPATTGPTARWSPRSSRDAAHLSYGQPVELSVRVEGVADLREVRLLARHADWAQPRRDRFRGFDAQRTWRLLAVCRPGGLGGVPGTTRDCRWDGEPRSATITYRWDPTASEPRGRAPWLPPARAAIDESARRCVPVTLAFEASDASGRRLIPARGKVARRCDARADGLGRTVYLDPLQPPPAPTTVKLRCLDVQELGCGSYSLSWKHPGMQVAGFRVWVERAEATRYVNDECEIVKHAGPWLAKTLPGGDRKWAVDGLSVYGPPEKALGKDWRVIGLRLSVSAFNAAGDSARVVATLWVQGGDDVIC
jgi:hypothetical protein